jgi:hypothetical protein
LGFFTAQKEEEEEEEEEERWAYEMDPVNIYI